MRPAISSLPLPSSSVGADLRIDRFLFFVRLTKSRTIAQSVIETGHVRIDGRRVAKPSEEVRAGNVISLPLHDRVRVIRVIALPGRRGPPAEAREHYAEVDAVSRP